MNKYIGVIEEINAHVITLFDQYEGLPFFYHNLHHTKFVVQRSYEIAAGYPLIESDSFTLIAAAWFHDTGHLNGSIKFHEERSVTFMRDFLQQKGIEEELIKNAEACICATKLPHAPKSLLEEILCDADTYNLGTPDFSNTDRLIKQELELRDINIDNWEEKKLRLLLSHRFFTDHCKTLLDKGKENNIKNVSVGVNKNQPAVN